MSVSPLTPQASEPAASEAATTAPGALLPVSGVASPASIAPEAAPAPSAAAPSASSTVPKPPMRVLVVTGISGAGKSTALRALEDLGYYCVDNLPLPLLGQFVSLLERSGYKLAALGIDAREGEFLAGFGGAMNELRCAGRELEVLFFDAPDEVLLRRFSETRRRHPLDDDDLAAGIRNERHELSALREEAQVVIDTGNLNVHQLKGVVRDRYGRASLRLAITLVTFGYKHGVPPEADLVFDVRFLPNPHFVERLSPLTGLEEEVARFVLSHPDAGEFMRRVSDFFEFYLPRAEREGKSYLTVAIGCTGGRHRSVAVATELFNRLRARYQITVRHRELGRGRSP
jgi:RNase adapter protein RapZ